MAGKCNRWKWLELAASFLLIGAVEAGGEGLRFLEPAEDSLVGWETSSVPLGNGWFGANVQFPNHLKSENRFVR